MFVCVFTVGNSYKLCGVQNNCIKNGNGYTHKTTITCTYLLALETLKHDKECFQLSLYIRYSAYVWFHIEINRHFCQTDGKVILNYFFFFYFVLVRTEISSLGEKTLDFFLKKITNLCKNKNISYLQVLFYPSAFLIFYLKIPKFFLTCLVSNANTLFY